ncbi:hypothetical protein F5B21DRAFT_509978 [Xylaria acuta]|nr:hypothetical protein F5B21DRAFT_509978 [Xylaria acuta]
MAPATAVGLHDPTKLRQSCDKYQNNKIRCSRDKLIYRRRPWRRTRKPSFVLMKWVSMQKEKDNDGSPESVTGVASLLSPDVTDRPVLLNLALLMKRVIGMLEDMFHLAAKSAQSVDQASDFVWCGTPGTSVPSALSARRVQRSLRNVASRPCVSLEMVSYRALHLDDFLVQGQAKTDAMGRILKLRV